MLLMPLSLEWPVKEDLSKMRKKNIIEAVELYLEDLPKADRPDSEPLITTLEASL